MSKVIRMIKLENPEMMPNPTATPSFEESTPLPAEEDCYPNSLLPCVRIIPREFMSDKL